MDGTVLIALRMPIARRIGPGHGPGLERPGRPGRPAVCLLLLLAAAAVPLVQGFYLKRNTLSSLAVQKGQ